MDQQNPPPPLTQSSYAGFFVRLAAHLFDRFLFILPFLTIGILLDWTIIQTKGIKELTIGFYIIYLIITTKVYQKSLGKHIFGLKIVYQSSQQISWGRVIVRELLARLISEILFLGYLYALFNKKRQAFHDKVTNIVVIQEKPLTRKTKFFIILIIIGLPLIAFSLAFKLTSRYFNQRQEIRDRSEAVEQKMDLLEYIGPLCESYTTQARLLRNNKCKNTISKTQECKLTDLSLPDLAELDLNIEKLTANCFKLQITREAQSSQQNVPPVVGANLQISLVDELGQVVEEGTITVSVKYQDFLDRNYNYSLDLKSLNDSLLPLYPPPSDILSTVTVWIITPAGKISDTLTINNIEYWNAVNATEQDYVATHQFDLNQNGTITNIVYNE